VLFNGSAQQHIVPGQSEFHSLRCALPKLRASFNVREQKGNSSSWKIIHHITLPLAVWCDCGLDCCDPGIPPAEVRRSKWRASADGAIGDRRSASVSRWRSPIPVSWRRTSPGSRIPAPTAAGDLQREVVLISSTTAPSRYVCQRSLTRKRSLVQIQYRPPV
jgi:hypothetical protein